MWTKPKNAEQMLHCSKRNLLVIIFSNIWLYPCTDLTYFFLAGTESPKGESSSLDEDSSDALSPDPQGSQDSPLSLGPQHSPSDMLNMNGDRSPSQVHLIICCTILQLHLQYARGQHCSMLELAHTTLLKNMYVVHVVIGVKQFLLQLILILNYYLTIDFILVPHSGPASYIWCIWPLTST